MCFIFQFGVLELCLVWLIPQNPTLVTGLDLFMVIVKRSLSSTQSETLLLLSQTQ